jgi:LysM repeat protein/predicted nucleic acid-binding Zn ribbon protein
MESKPQRRCPRCGTPVAQRAESCLMCGATLKEQKKRRLRLPQGDVLWPLVVVIALVLVWLWKPWQTETPQAMAGVTPSATPTATAPPSATYALVPTATPLYSPTPPPTATLPPDQTIHTVESGETVSSIAREYGTTSTAILQANGLKTNTIISVGQQLIIPLPPANTSTPTITPTPSPTPFEYTIKSGETLSAIAKRYKTTVEALMEANDIVDATLVRAGTKIIIVQPPDFTATMAYETYEVKQGDTLYTLSSKFNLTIAAIKEINNLSSDNLSVGQKLRIPVGTATPVPTLTATPTLTPTPGPPYPAPVLLAPVEGAAFEGAGTAILLSWASVGILEQDEWYVVRLRRSGVVAEQLPLAWTKATSYRLPAGLYIEGLTEPQRFYWQVMVMRQTGIDQNGTWLGEAASPSSGTRTFTWK